VIGLPALCARHGISLSDAEGFDRDAAELRAAAISYLVTRTNELFATVERLAPVKGANLYSGRYQAAETALRFALVDLDSLKPTLGEIASVGEQIEKETVAA